MIRRQFSDSWELKRDLDPHKYQIEEMYRAVEKGRPVPVTLEEARWTIVLMEAIRAAATSKTEPAATSR